MRRGFKTWAEKVAIEQRQLLGLQENAPLAAKSLADRLDVTVISPNQLPGVTHDVLYQLLDVDPESWSATTISRNGCVLTIFNPAHSFRRQESDLMHEMAHLLCKHEPTRIISIGNISFSLRNFDPAQEEEATWLGGCLQIPRKALLWAISRGMDNAAMVSYYGASENQVQYRRHITGVDFQVNRRLTKSKGSE